MTMEDALDQTTVYVSQAGEGTPAIHVSVAKRAHKCNIEMCLIKLLGCVVKI